MRILLTLDRDAGRRETNDYVRALVAAGFRKEEIEILPPGSPVRGDFDGLVLGGGGDVDPGRYGEAPRADANLELDPERDRTDFALFERAWRDSVPILAICRGLQVANVARGGTLVQDLPTERASSIVHETAPRDETRREHRVRVERGTRLAEIAGGVEIDVNSRHHQAVERVAPDLVATAVAPDGVVEGLEPRAEKWMIAVQWHPENLAGDPASERLFAEFANAVKERRPVGRASD